MVALLETSRCDALSCFAGLCLCCRTLWRCTGSERPGGQDVKVARTRTFPGRRFYKDPLRPGQTPTCAAVQAQRSLNALVTKHSQPQVCCCSRPAGRGGWVSPSPGADALSSVLRAGPSQAVLRCKLLERQSSLGTCNGSSRPSAVCRAISSQRRQSQRILVVAARTVIDAGLL